MKWLFDWLVLRKAPISPAMFGWCNAGVSLAALAYGGIHPHLFVERALAGQTEDSNGIYFAGTKLEPECETYERFSRQFYEGEGAHRNSLTITWHTGYGDLGHLQYMGNPSDFHSPRLVNVLKQHMGANDDLTTLDFCPTFETCNDETVWLRNVDPSRQPNQAGTTLDGYLTAEIGGLGGVEFDLRGPDVGTDQQEKSQAVVRSRKRGGEEFQGPDLRSLQPAPERGLHEEHPNPCGKFLHCDERIYRGGASSPTERAGRGAERVPEAITALNKTLAESEANCSYGAGVPSIRRGRPSARPYLMD